MDIKVCGINNLDNLKDVLALGPEYVGFNFYPASKRFCRFEIPSTLDFGKSKKVGVFVNASIDQIQSCSEKYGLDCIQLHGDEDQDLCRSLKTRLAGQKIIKVFRISDSLPDTEAWEGLADYFLFDTDSQLYGGSGDKFDWQILKALKSSTAYFLAGGLSAADAGKIKVFAAENPGLKAVDINSRFEISPGYKDTSLLSGFFGELRK